MLTVRTTTVESRDPHWNDSRIAKGVEAMTKRFIAILGTMMVGLGVLLAVPHSAHAATQPQVQGRVIPLRVTVSGDDVTFRFYFKDIGKDPVPIAFISRSGVTVRGCDSNNDGLGEVVLTATETQTGDYIRSYTTKASKLGSNWTQSLSASESFKDSLVCHHREH